MEQKTEKLQDGIVQKIFAVIKKSWGIMLAIVLFGAIVGLVYANLIKPTYTATCKTVYKAEFTDKSSYNNVSLTKSYLKTFIDFCDEGCVVDRANFYYKEFKDSGETNVEKYVDLIKERLANKTDTYDPDKGNTYKNNDILIANLAASSANKDDENFAVNIKYTDPSSQEAVIKAKIIIVAIGAEANVKVSPTSQNSKYFGNATIHLNDLSEGTAVSGHINKVKITLIGAAAGLILSCVVVYIINVSNRTVRTREEIERITGVGLLAYIADQGE